MSVVVVAPRAAEWILDAVRDGGAEPVVVSEPTAVAVVEALVWTDPAGPEALGRWLEEHPDIAWIQLPWAGVEPYAAAGIFDVDRRWTCGKDVYSEPVAEMALAMLLAGLRGFDRYVRVERWTEPIGRNLYGAHVCILGAGGITAELLRLLAPFRVTTTVVRRRDEPLPGADRTVTLDRLDDVIAAADAVVLALSLTPETEGIINADRLAAMADHAWLINVARGGHVVTDELVHALRSGAIGGAALDVTDPEPLPEGHPLWELPNCIITPHIGNTPEMAVPLLRHRITENVRRYLAGEDLIGAVDPELGY